MDDKTNNKWLSNIILFLSGQAISLFGSSLVQYCIIWYITLETKSGIMLTISTLCGFLPQIFISLFAGVWADRYNKKNLIMIADGTIALATLIVAILFIFGFDNIFVLFAVLIIRSLGSGVQTPVIGSFVPEIVPKKELMKVSGINSAIQSIILILSPLASGALLRSVDLSYIFLIDIFTAMIAIFLTFLINDSYKKKNIEDKVDYLKDIKLGFNYLKEHTLIKKLFNYYFILSFLMSPIAILTPLMIARNFSDNTWYLTLNEISFCVGSIIGGIGISIWGGFKNKIKTIGFGSLLFAIFCMLLGLSKTFTFYLTMIGFCGVFIPFVTSPFAVILQERIKDEYQGRIFSLLQIVTGAVIPFSMIIYGPLSDIFKIEHLVIFTSILFIIAAMFLIKNKTIKIAYLEKVKEVEEEEEIEIL